MSLRHHHHRRLLSKFAAASLSMFLTSVARSHHRDNPKAVCQLRYRDDFFFFYDWCFSAPVGSYGAQITSPGPSSPTAGTRLTALGCHLHGRGEEEWLGLRNNSRDALGLDWFATGCTPITSFIESRKQAQYSRAVVWVTKDRNGDDGLTRF